MSRFARAALLLLGLTPLVATAQMLPPDELCSLIGPPEPVTVGQLVLEIQPDLPKELRIIGEYLGKRECRDRGLARLERYRKAYPKDFRIAVVDSRVLRESGNDDAAFNLLRPLIARQPGFASAQVQMGSLMLGFQQEEEARKYLAAAAALQRSDFWMTLHTLRLHSRKKPVDPKFVRGLMAFAEAPGAPGDARELAASEIARNFAFDPDTRERAYRSMLDFDSATPKFMKQVNLAVHIVEDHGRIEEGRALILPVLAEHHDYDFGKMILAETYLLEAARVHPAPSPKNAALIGKARAALDGDLSPLLPRVSFAANLAHLRPFLLASKPANPDASQHGVSALCSAVASLDPAAIRFALEAGADPALLCNGRSPLRFLVAAPGAPWDRKREVLDELMKAGMDPDAPLEPGERHSAASFCQQESEDCKRELMPVMLEYRRKGVVDGPPGDKGGTPICRALHALDFDAVKAEMGEDFDPDQTCNGWTLLGWIVRMDNSAPWHVKREIVTALLKAGVDPDVPVLKDRGRSAIDDCAQRSHQCKLELLPVLLEYQRKKVTFRDILRSQDIRVM